MTKLSCGKRLLFRKENKRKRQMNLLGEIAFQKAQKLVNLFQSMQYLQHPIGIQESTLHKENESSSDNSFHSTLELHLSVRNSSI